MSESSNIVEGWLRSLNLVQYTQSFIDNGYDDLEVCKQIGELDLDAIGIGKKEHRDKLSRAVRTLREEGGTAVYFTLEETIGASPHGLPSFYDDSVLAQLGAPPDPPDLPEGHPIRLDAYDVGKTALLTYPKVQLKIILKTKLKEDDVDLAGPPYTTQEYGLCRSSLTALAVKYAEELKTHFEDVLERLEDLWHIARELDSYTLPVNHSPMHGIYGSSTAYGFSARNVPPPLPSIPPPSSSHVERCTDPQCHIQATHRHDNYVHQNYVAIDGDAKGTDDGKKKTSTLSRFLRNIGIRRSGKKHSYKQHSGDPRVKRTDPFSVSGDPNAFDITMNDEERIALMVMVKEGKISTETALEVVRRFEDERLRDSNGSLVENDGKENMGGHGVNPMSKKKKSPGSKPSKSHSAVYADAGPRCHICQHVIIAEDYEDHHLQNNSGMPEDQLYVCCRHKRVHSVGHIEFPHHVHSPLFTRALSCSPSRNPNLQLSTFGGGESATQSPSQNHLYSPILAHSAKVMQPSLPQSMEAIKERLSGKTRDFMHKTTSRTSLLSSESDHSMECSQHGPLKSEVLTTRIDDTNYCSNSTVSMSSENSPAVGRKKEDIETKPRSRYHRSASYSTGDDCISSENDEHDNTHLLGGWNRDHRNKLGGRLREMRFELKKKVMKNKEEKQNIPVSNCSVYNTNRPPLLRTTSHGGYIPPAPAPNTQMPLYGCFQPSGAEATVYTGPFLGKASVIKSFTPSEEERDFLQTQKGDIIHIINMAQSGVWRGAIKGQVGNFYFSNVEVIVDDGPVNQRKDKQHRRRNPKKSKPKSVEELMQRIGLEHLTSLLLLNGYDQLDILSEMDEEDLSILNITDPEQRAKLLTAAELLLDFDSTDTSDSHVKSDQSEATSDTPCSLSPSVVHSNNGIPAQTNNVSRDSGCYASSEQLPKTSTPYNKSPLSQQTYSSGHVKGGKSHCKMCNTCGKQKAENEDCMDTDKSDREYTEEDKEVSAITNSCTDGKPPPSNSRSSSACAKSHSQCRICKHNSTRAGVAMAHNTSQMTEGIYPRLMCQSAQGTSNYQSIYGKHKKQKPVPPPRISSAQDSINFAERKSAGTQADYHGRVMSPGHQPGHQCQYHYRAYPVLTNSHSFGGQSANPKSPVYKSGYSSSKDGRKSVEPIYAASQKTLKNVSRSLIPLVTTKLGAEKIDFSLEPYSNQKGECGIPPLLVQRYAEELRQDIISVALVLEQVRIIQLQSLDRTCVPNERLADSCSEACDLKIATVSEFFVSIGLPMYTEDVIAGSLTTIEQLLKTSENQFSQLTGADSRHLKRLMHAIEWVRSKLASPTRSAKNKPIINIIDKV